MFVGDALGIVVVSPRSGVARTIARRERPATVKSLLVRTRLGQHRALVGVVEVIIELVVEFLQPLVVVEIGRGRLDGLLIRRGHGAKGRHLDDLAPEEHMRQPEAPADEPAIAKGALDLFGQRAGGDVEVLGCDAQQHVTHASADEEGFEAGLAQAVQHTQRIGRDRGTRYGMFGTWNDACGGPEPGSTSFKT